MSDEIRAGFWRDHSGEWHRDRREKEARRKSRSATGEKAENRMAPRRKIDRELLEKEHQELIDEALEDFSSPTEE